MKFRYLSLLVVAAASLAGQGYARTAPSQASVRGVESIALFSASALSTTDAQAPGASSSSAKPSGALKRTGLYGFLDGDGGLYLFLGFGVVAAAAAASEANNDDVPSSP